MSDQNMREAIRDAIGAHGAWKLRLKTAVVSGRGDISSTDARCDDHCKFGQWLKTMATDDGIRHGKPYQVVRRLHSEFHMAAGDVLAAAEKGRHDDAAALLDGAFTDRSETLKTALTKWLGEVS